MKARLVLAIACFFLVGASAGPDWTTEARCKAYTLTGTNAASNLLDRCTSTSSPDQDGVDDQTVTQDTDCNDSELPAFLESSRRSCFFDGLGDGLTTAEATLGQTSSFFGWVKGLDALDTGFVSQRSNGSAGRGLLFRNCGVGFVRLDAVIGGSQLFGTTCSTSWLNTWHFTGVGWSGVSGEPGRLFGSLNAASNTLAMGELNAANAYGDPGVPHWTGRRVQTGFDIEGYMVELVNIDGDVLACEACSVCRCGAGNMNPKTNGITGWKYDNIDMCNDCAFCSGQTHCGPPRRMM